MLRKVMLGLALVLSLLGLMGSPPVRAAGIQKFSNNAVTTLADPITSTTATTLTVASTSAFPTLTGSNWFVATLEHLVSGVVTADEIVKVTADSSNTWTVVRAQEGTTGLTWQVGDTVALLPTAGGLAQFVQPVQAQGQGYNYAADTGSVNSYVVALTPAVSEPVIGMPITFMAAHTNTGGSVFNGGSGAETIVRQDGVTLQGGEIQAGSIDTVVWNGSAYELTSSIGNWVLKSPPGGATQTLTGPLYAPQFIAEGPAASTFMELYASDAPANQGQWIWTLGSSSLDLSAWNDAHSAATDAIQITRTGDTVQNISFGGATQQGTTQGNSDNSTDLATTAFVQNLLSSSPNLGGTPLTPTASPGTNTTQIASTAFVQAAGAALISGTLGTNGSVSFPVSGSGDPLILKWGFHTPGTNAGAGLETISFPVAFPHNCFFAAAFSNRSTTGTTPTGYVDQASITDEQFQAVIDQDPSGNRSALWIAIGD